jgi:antitoxin component of MazEF toxin-antitoxin module
MSLKPALLHFKFDNFAKLPARVGNSVDSDVQTDCNQKKWSLRLYPGGISSEERTYISLYLMNNYKEDVSGVDFVLTLKNTLGDIACEMKYTFTTFTDIKVGTGYGSPAFIERSLVLDEKQSILINGELHVDALIQTKLPKNAVVQQANSLPSKILGLLESGDSSDVSFDVENETIKAHSFVLKLGAPLLADLCRNEEGDVNAEGAILTINDTTAEVFKLALRYVYGDSDLRDEIMVKLGNDLISFADRFELIELKDTVEGALVRNCVVDKTNVSDYILFADSKNCPKLKDYAVSFFMLTAHDVLKSEDSNQLRESTELLTELCIAMSIDKNDVVVNRG